jgi:hypothetical protein
MRILMGTAGWKWVDDPRQLEEKLRFARSWGYHGFVYAFNAPALLNSRGDSNWYRDSSTRYRWTLADGGRPGHAQVRTELVASLRAVKTLAERQGYEFIPQFGPFGWGNTLTEIDPAAAAGAYYDMEIPDAPPEAFALRRKNPSGILDSTAQWGDARGEVDLGYSPGGFLERGSLRMPAPGIKCAQFIVRPGRDAYWNLEFELEGTGRGDSAFLKVYRFQGWENHPFSTKRAAWSGASVTGSRQILQTRFFSKAGQTYFLDLEFQCLAPSGATLRIRKARMRQAIPPRALLINSGAYERRGPGGASLLDKTAEAGLPWESKYYTLAGSRKLAWENTRFFQLDATAQARVWENLSAIRGQFADQESEAFRKPVDPLFPATGQIFREVVGAVAEAIGKKPRFFHLGGDEIFSLASRRYSQPPYATMDKGGILSHILKERVREVDAVFRLRFPSDTTQTAYLIYGDMFSSAHGYGDATLGGRKWFASDDMKPGKILLVPWYYNHAIGHSTPWYDKFGFPRELPAPEKFTRLLRKEARELSEGGIDFLGFYAVDDPGKGMEEEVAGARAWGRICREFRFARRGKCRGLVYSGWDPGGRAEWGSAYNGLIPTALFGWMEPSGIPWDKSVLADGDKDGVLDAITSLRRGPYPVKRAAGAQ